YSYRKQGKLGLAINESMKAANFLLENRKSNQKSLGFKVKIVRMPDFSDKAGNHSKELHYTLLPPLALGQIVAYLKAHAVEIDQDDLNISIHYDQHYSRTPVEELDTTVFFNENRILKYISGAEDQGIEAILEEVAKKSRFCEYGVILFSLREIYANASCFLFTLSLARFLKKKYNPTLILGGSGQSIDLLRRYDCRDIDYIIYHENETVLLELLLALKDQDKLSKFLDSRMKADGKVISTKLTDAHPPLKPDFSGLPMNKYRYSEFTHDLDESCKILEKFDQSGTLLLPFKFIRGCPHECAFCTMSNNKIMFVLDAPTVALYLKELQEEHHPTGFFFLSDTLNISKQYVNELCDEIIKNKTKILWSDCARADNLDKDTLFKMRQAGCIRLIYGIETASTRLLKYVRKGISLKKLEDTLKWSDEAGIWTGVEIICGLPHEQERDIEETIAFLNKNKRYIDTLYINQFDLRDGSMLLSRAKELGIENVSRIDQYATEEFSNFHKYKYDEIDGLRWPDKRKQIVHSYKKLLDQTEGNDFFSYELEHLLFFLYHQFGDKQKVRQMYDEIALKKTALKNQKAGHGCPCS
ncbi:MAG: radical SAM protein, partial [Candidatus Omnitrophota bacterium]